MRLLIAALLAAVLAACDLGASTPTQQELPSTDESMAASSMGTEESMAESSADESSATAMTCEDAFAAIDVTAVESLEDLDAVTAELDDTITACADVAEWEAAAQTTVPMLNLEDAETWLAARCAEEAALAGTPICEEVAA